MLSRQPEQPGESRRMVIRDLKRQMAGETRAREVAQARAALQEQIAGRAEQALRDLRIDRDRWRERAEAAEAELASRGGR
jgi:hypothetical protein